MITEALLLFLVLSAVATLYMRDLLAAIVIFSGYSLIMAALWTNLRAPDIALTEAAVGAGITPILFIAAISKIGRHEK